MPPKLNRLSKTVRIQIHAPEALITRVDTYGAEQPDLPNRSEVFRRFTAKGLDKWEANKRRRAK